MSRAALFWIFVYVRDLFIGYSYKSSIAIVQSWHDHGRKKLFCETVRQKRTDRRDSPEFKKRSAAEAIDVLFHWQCLVKVHSKVRNGCLKRNATSTYICRLAVDRTDTHWWTYKHHLSFFLCQASVCCFASMTKYRLYRIECWTEQKWNRRVVHCQRFLCHQHTCDSHSCDIIWHQTGVVSTGWIVTSPKTDPRGTPKTKSIGVDFKPSTITDCVLSLWYDSNQDSATPKIPKVLSSRLNRMAWSRVSKAALSASTDTSSWSDFVRRPSSTLKTAVSVLWYFLYADCRISSKLFAQRWDCSWRRTIPSLVSSRRMGDLRLVWNFLNR